MRTALMSIKPIYAYRILDGSKTFELRRRPMRLVAGDRVVIYASAPVQAIVGSFRVRAMISGGISRLWNQLGEHFGTTEESYRQYFKGIRLVRAIGIEDVKGFPFVSLDLIRAHVDGFYPPQSYCWMSGSLLDLYQRKQSNQ